MARRRKGEPALGDQVRVTFGNHEYIGTVTYISGYRVHVTIEIEGADDPVNILYRASELVPA